MFAKRLGQTLIVKPEIAFQQIAAVMDELGWRKEGGVAATPLLKGEPETATWTREGHKPFVIYTFNPVAGMRVLDVATLPPVYRQALAQHLPLLQEQEVKPLLESPDARRRLLGLWIAQECERTDLIDEVDRLRGDTERPVAKQAREIGAKLQRVAEARLTVMAQLQLLVHEDCERLFDPAITDTVMRLCEHTFRQHPSITPLSPEAEIIATAAPAGLLRWSNELSDKFPAGYRDIAGWMQPDKLWMTWKTKEPNGSTVQYDGLVWLQDRWLWLPKIHRQLAPLCVSGNIYANATLH
jgi:hypothetical protein